MWDSDPPRAARIAASRVFGSVRKQAKPARLRGGKTDIRSGPSHSCVWPKSCDQMAKTVVRRQKWPIWDQFDDDKLIASPLRYASIDIAQTMVLALDVSPS